MHSPHLFYAQTLTVSMGDEKHKFYWLCNLRKVKSTNHSMNLFAKNKQLLTFKHQGVCIEHELVNSISAINSGILIMDIIGKL